MTIQNAMRNELTNLLPIERQQALRRDYFLRLGVVILALITALILTASVLLVPTYIFLAQSSGTKTNSLASMESALSSADELTFSRRLAALSENAATLAALASVPSSVSLIRDVLSIPRPGVTLSGFKYTSTKGENQSTLAVSGTAATRDALRNYQLAVSGSSFVRSADLPVSAYAKDSDIEFTIVMTIAP